MYCLQLGSSGIQMRWRWHLLALTFVSPEAKAVSAKYIWIRPKSIIEFVDHRHIF